MKKLNYNELKNMWLDFYRDRGHAIIPSASVVPENDPSVLFTNSGMHPLVPYLLGERHPAGVRLANVQKCIRTGDIDEVGDATHLTFFEMMGNWSLGDYFKKEKIAWSWEFLTDKKYLAIGPERIHVTCFEGDEIAPRDEESAKYWHAQGVPDERIHFLPKSENWWQLPNGTGPQGPCSEMFIDRGTNPCSPECNPSCSCGKFVEIGNDVYMQFVVKNAGETPVPAKQQNVDTGCGLERILCFSNGVESVYETELFMPAFKIIEADCGKKYNHKEQTEQTKAFRVLAEHTRAAVVILGDGVMPSNTGQGYVLRRLIRRAVRKAHTLGCSDRVYKQVLNCFIDLLGATYPELEKNRKAIERALLDEVTKFEKTLTAGLKEVEKVVKFVGGKVLGGNIAFKLYETYGFPLELTREVAAEHGLTINMDEYNAAKAKHAEKSQTAAAGSFKGGMADTTDATQRLHTAAHILLAVLRKIYGTDVNQKGSNITPERLRFDFNLDHKMSDEELKAVESAVNEIIEKKLEVTMQEMPLDAAKKMGAVGIFDNKYGQVVKVFTIGEHSCELCGGPHVSNTAELGRFKIQKEESVAAGVRRIKAVLVG